MDTFEKWIEPDLKDELQIISEKMKQPNMRLTKTGKDVIRSYQ